MINEYLPNDTYEVIKNRFSQIDNVSLKINKYPIYKLVNEKSWDHKKKFFHENFDKKKFDVLNNKDFSLTESDLDKIYEIDSFEMEQKDKMVVGLGESSVLENAITLHHIYGFPYIPGQAVKGTLRHYYINKNFDKLLSNFMPDYLDNLHKDENAKKIKALYNKYIKFLDKFNYSNDIFSREYNNFCTCLDEMRTNIHNCSELYDFMKTKADEVAEKDKKYKFIFGTQEQQGKVIFFDALPTQFGSLEVDIMNNHYQKYYAGDKYPTDDMQPVPVTCLVAKGFKFKFYLGTKKSNEKILTPLNTIAREVKDCLIDHGIGAKTAVGYGYFNVDPERKKKEIEQAEKLKQKEKEIRKSQNTINKLRNFDKGAWKKLLRDYSTCSITDRDQYDECIKSFFSDDHLKSMSEQKINNIKLLFRNKNLSCYKPEVKVKVENFRKE